jgi:hypothetical protein
VIASAANPYHFVAPAKAGADPHATSILITRIVAPAKAGAHPSAAATLHSGRTCVADEGWAPAFAGTTVSRWVGDVA